MEQQFVRSLSKGTATKLYNHELMGTSLMPQAFFRSFECSKTAWANWPKRCSMKPSSRGNKPCKKAMCPPWDVTKRATFGRRWTTASGKAEKTEYWKVSECIALIPVIISTHFTTYIYYIHTIVMPVCMISYYCDMKTDPMWYKSEFLNELFTCSHYKLDLNLI